LYYCKTIGGFGCFSNFTDLSANVDTVIDDVLTLSRLDSNLLLISPETCKPVELINSALKMFDAEIKRAEIKFDFAEHKSLYDLKVDWLMLDCSRVLQILINLVTNAIKFTK
jgi:signal transduction histidine kinase